MRVSVLLVFGVSSNGCVLVGFAPLMNLVMVCLYTAACAAIHARTSPTFQHVTRIESLMGFGNMPLATMRQSVGAEKGRGAGVSGRFGLCTS